MRSSHRPWEGGLEWVWSRWCLRLQSEPELWQQHIPTTVSQDFMRVFREGHYSLTIYSINMQPVLNWLSEGKGKRNQSQLYWETMIFQPWCQTHHYLVLTKAMTKPSGWNRSQHLVAHCFWELLGGLLRSSLTPELLKDELRHIKHFICTKINLIWQHQIRRG